MVSLIICCYMRCNLHSFAASGESTCMEFDDGKILLSSDFTLPEDAWTLLAIPRGITVQDARFVEHPRISTSAGDNFNGASRTALLLGLCDADRMEFANDFAHYYVKNGVNSSSAQLMIRK